MAEQARRDKAAELDRKVNELQQVWGQLQKDLSEREREMTSGIFDKMATIIHDIAEADGFTMVLERTELGPRVRRARARPDERADPQVQREVPRRRGGAKKPAAKPTAAPAKK